MTAPTRKPEQVDVTQLDRTRNRNRFLTITVVVLAVALLGLGVWFVYDQTTVSETAVPAEIEQLLDDYVASWENNDEALLRQTITDDYSFNNHIYLHYVAGNRPGTYLHEGLSEDDLSVIQVITREINRGWQIEQVDPVILTGDGPPWFVSVEEIRIAEGLRDDGVATYLIVEQDGALKIAKHYWAGIHTATD